MRSGESSFSTTSPHAVYADNFVSRAQSLGFSAKPNTDGFLTNPKYAIDDFFDRLVEQAGIRGLPDSTYSTNSPHIEMIQYNDAVS
jgi:hypothetical protein